MHLTPPKMMEMIIKLDEDKRDFDVFMGKNQKLPRIELVDCTLRCSVCHQEYKCWWTTTENWQKLDQWARWLSLCQGCYYKLQEPLSIEELKNIFKMVMIYIRDLMRSRE